MHTDLVASPVNLRINESVVITPAVAAQQRVITDLIRHLNIANFSVVRVFDGDTLLSCANEKKAVSIIFDALYDEVSLYFRHVTGGVEHEVMLGTRTGTDIVKDWNYSRFDHDGFCKAMHKFDGSCASDQAE